MSLSWLSIIVLIALLALGWWNIWFAPSILLAIVATLFVVSAVLEHSGRFVYSIGGKRSVQ